VKRKGNGWALIFIILVFLSILYPLIGLPLLALSLILFIFWYTRYYKIRVETLQELMSSTPSRFERAMATLLGDLGYMHVRVTGGQVI